MHRSRAIGVIGIIGWLWGCASQSAYTPETYVVRQQDTLYGIAWRHDLDYHDLARWNHIGSDYRITVGQILTLRPPARVEAASAPRPSARPPAPRSAQSQTSPSKPTDTPVPPPPAPRTGNPPVMSEGEGLRWVWPTARVSPPRPVPGGGVLLLGQLGQPVRAASSGHVVYVGNGLRSYGNLIIIKHGESLLSAYAHTRELAVHEGEDVVAGQPIAQMGTGPHQIAALYFEIRLNGKPVDPLPYLALAK